MIFVLIFIRAGLGDPIQDLQSSLKVSEWGQGPVCSWVGIFCDWDSNITSLSLTGLSFNGTIPLNIFPRLKKLKVFSAVNLYSQNNTLGLPNDICSFQSLIQIEIYNYSIQAFPQLNNCINLQILHLTYCNINYELPSFTNLLELKIVELNNNNIIGNIPSSLAMLPNLEILNLVHNKITGNLPSAFYSSNLSVIDVRYNLLTGVVSVLDI
jgi:Leucine-rich repeat (LRR) protein